MHQQLVEAFITAASAAVAEMAGTQAAMRDAGWRALDGVAGTVVAVIDLDSATLARLVLSCPEATASALAGRVLADKTDKLDTDLVRDCMGEIANVVAGQAKALLAGTPYQFTFAVPRVFAAGDEDVVPAAEQTGLSIDFGSDAGPFGMQLVMKR
jgi:chemotaxis protein CheX